MSWLFSAIALTTSSMPFEYLKLKTAATTIRAAVKAEAGHIDPMADERIEIPSRDGDSRTIPVNVYRPTNPKNPAAYLVNFYGSSFVLDALRGSDVEFLREMAEKTGHVIYDVEYRLAPEHPYPAAAEDGEDVINSLPPGATTSLSGFASGGNIALALSATASISARIKSVFTLYPTVDLSLSETELVAPDTSNPGKMPAEAAGVLNDCYTYGDTDKKDPRVSPFFADPSSFPADVYVFTAARDPHCVSGEELAEKIKAAGKNVRWKRFDGCGDLFDKKPEEGSAQAQATREVYELYANYLAGL